MNHIEFEDDHNYPTMLTSAEIANPFLVLKETFGNDATADPVQEEYWELIYSAIRPFLWMRNDSPLVLFKKYKKLLRLIEAGFLISVIRPKDNMRGTMLKNAFPGLKKERPLSPNINTPIPPLSSSLGAYENLMESYYYENQFVLMRDHLYLLVLESLNATCLFYYKDDMESIVNGHSEKVRATMQSLFILLNQEGDKDISEKERQMLLKFQQFATNYESPTYRQASPVISNIFSYFSKEQLLDAMEEALSILYEVNYWKIHNNPGNILYLFMELRNMVDVIWEYQNTINVGNGENLKIEWQLPQDVSNELKYLKGDEKKYPLRILVEIFQKKTLTAFHTDLDEWEEAILNNENTPNSICTTMEDLKSYLKKIADIASIHSYAPEFNL